MGEIENETAPEVLVKHGEQYIHADSVAQMVAAARAENPSEPADEKVLRAVRATMEQFGRDPDDAHVRRGEGSIALIDAAGIADLVLRDSSEGRSLRALASWRAERAEREERWRR